MISHFARWRRKPGKLAHREILVAMLANGHFARTGVDKHVQCYTLDRTPFGLSEKRLLETFEPVDGRAPVRR